MPLAWDEGDSISPDGIRLRSVEQRLTSDPWADLEPIDVNDAATDVSEAINEAGIRLEPFNRFRS